MINLLLLAALAAQPPYTIQYDLGGPISVYREKAETLRAENAQIIIDGPCYSACTILADEDASQVCITAKAVFGFHLEFFEQNSFSGITPSWGWGSGDFSNARVEVSYKTPGLNAWIKSHGGEPSSGALLMYYSDAVKFFPACPEDLS